VMDWASRKVLSWRISNTLTADFCIEAVQEAIHRYGRPDIFNTDQGSQFTSLEITQLLKAHQIAISMDGKGAWRDNVFVERLWKTLKYEDIYLRAYDTVSAVKQGIGRYLDFYNRKRPHQSLDGIPPDRFYYDNLHQPEMAA
ncbi:MAG: DDE-type integrase/transposase/recombinase, partial [Oxalobacter sp.]|nr:DDE-type integrase/transposase/recombinase [Oxalobacter sp.]